MTYEIRTPVWLDTVRDMNPTPTYEVTWHTIEAEHGARFVEEVGPAGVMRYGPMPSDLVKAFCEERRSYLKRTIER